VGELIHTLEFQLLDRSGLFQIDFALHIGEAAGARKCLQDLVAIGFEGLRHLVCLLWRILDLVRRRHDRRPWFRAGQRLTVAVQDRATQSQYLDDVLLLAGRLRSQRGAVYHLKQESPSEKPEQKNQTDREQDSRSPFETESHQPPAANLCAAAAKSEGLK